jgi:GcrA cell cycle regulator
VRFANAQVLIWPAGKGSRESEDFMSWTDERVEHLKKLWIDGLSASQIAAELGQGITRNAVIGKVHRLGLSGREKSSSSVQSTRPRAKQPARTAAPRNHPPLMSRGNTALATAPRAYAPPAPRPVEEVVIPMSERVTLLELKEAMCRWPLGDPTSSDFRFCGLKTPDAGTYCTYHARIAYQPPQDRRRERERRGLRPG